MSLQEAGINPHAHCEAKIVRLQSELHVEKLNALQEKRARFSYYNKHCATKKRWLVQNQDLKREVEQLKEEKKSTEYDLDLFERMLCAKDQTIAECEKMLGEREEKIKQMQAEYKDLLDQFIDVKVQFENRFNDAQ